MTSEVHLATQVQNPGDVHSGSLPSPTWGN